MRKTKSGFTIVELLIVIVVIGILAAITIVAYNGIQKRAQDSSRLSAMNQLKKAIEISYANNGVSPSCASSVCSSTGYEGDISLLVGSTLKDPVNVSGQWGYYYAFGYKKTSSSTFSTTGSIQDYIIATRLNNSSTPTFSGWDNGNLNYLDGN